MDEKNGEEEKKRNFAYDSQKRRIERLMENPYRPIELADTSMSLKKKYEPPEFVRNIMGSSAGAGSGEFHVYRHLRRREMTRLKEMEKTEQEHSAETEFKRRFEENKRLSEEKTLKRRLKRKRKKQTKKNKQKVPGVGQETSNLSPLHKTNSIDPLLANNSRNSDDSSD